MTYKHAQRISSATPPPSGRKPKLNVASRQINGLLTQLETYHEIYSPLFQRQEQRYWSLKYMQGQMLDIERKSIEPLARPLDDGNVQAMQQFTSASPWQTANCQAGVFLAYASELGHTLLDRRLYMPEHWFSAEYAALRNECDVPEEVPFQTKNELVWTMLQPLLEEAIVPFEWIAFDEAFGRDTKLLNKIHQKSKSYFAEIPCDTLAWRQPPKVQTPKVNTGCGRRATQPQLARLASSHDHDDTTVSQLRHLLNVTLPKREFDAQAMLAEIQRTQQQNYPAYRSHRKCRRKQKPTKPTY